MNPKILKTLARELCKPAVFAFIGLELLISSCIPNREIRTAMTLPVYEQFADVNADGNPDRVYISPKSGLSLKFNLNVKFNDGKGGYTELTQIYQFALCPDYFFVGDLNSTGKADLIYLFLDYNRKYKLVFVPEILRGNETTLKQFTKALESVNVADVNGDGYLDIAFTDNKYNLYVLENDKGGSFKKERLLDKIKPIHF